jgi:hypothetical protein
MTSYLKNLQPLISIGGGNCNLNINEYNKMTKENNEENAASSEVETKEEEPEDSKDCFGFNDSYVTPISNTLLKQFGGSKKNGENAYSFINVANVLVGPLKIQVPTYVTEFFERKIVLVEEESRKKIKLDCSGFSSKKEQRNNCV